MPKFIYSLIGATVLAWATLAYIASQTSPDSTLKILSIATILFLVLTLTFTLITFLIANARSSILVNKHKLFKKTFHYGVIISAFTTGFLTLRAFELATFLNSLLYIALCTILYTQLKSKRV